MSTRRIKDYVSLIFAWLSLFTGSAALISFLMSMHAWINNDPVQLEHCLAAFLAALIFTSVNMAIVMTANEHE